MTDPTPSDTTDGFAARVKEMHVPVPKAEREALLLKLGWVLVAVGLVLVAAGYYGASGTREPAEQIPFAISGGAGGLGLIVTGCALLTRYSLARMFRFWLARVVYEHQVQTDRTVEALGRIESALTSGAGAGAAPAAGPTPTSSPNPAQGSEAPRVRTEPLRAEPLDG